MRLLFQIGDEPFASDFCEDRELRPPLSATDARAIAPLTHTDSVPTWFTAGDVDAQGIERALMVARDTDWLLCRAIGQGSFRSRGPELKLVRKRVAELLAKQAEAVYA